MTLDLFEQDRLLRCSVVMFLHSILSLVLLCTSVVAQINHIWPPPTYSTITGDPLSLSTKFTFILHPNILKSSNQTRLLQAVNRYSNLINSVVHKAKGSSLSTLNNVVSKVELRINKNSAINAFKLYPSITTDYSYSFNLSSTSNTAYCAANSQYGLMYCMESVVQLTNPKTGAFYGNDIKIVDNGGFYKWRGLMIDSGRRFVPVDTLQNILTTMSAVKMNVLHLHASDMCRFGVESKRYPNLTASLTGIHEGFYKQTEIKALIEYGANLGIRIVPEFDVPGHSRGIRPLESDGVQFCRGTDEDVNQLLNDPAGVTYSVIKDLLEEMSDLFVDDVFNIGCDETGVVDDCTLNSTFTFERKLFNEIATSFKKTPSGWEEAAFDAGAATKNTIVDAWARHSAAEVILNGWNAIESKDSAFYMTAAVPGGAAGWSKMWYDISTGVSPANMSMLLGGEISMWTDTYCFSDQCGAFGPGHAVPVGAPLFAPDTDAAFAQSIGGMIWPRGYVGAAAFYSYNSTVDPSSKDFVESIWELNDKLIARNLLVCPTKCTCDQLTACGKPYLK